MKRFYVQVTQVVKVELDEWCFSEDFMEEFRESFYPFTTLEEHAEHIAQLEARGLTDLGLGSQFVEGYGESGDMGIRAKVLEVETEQVDWK